MRKKLSKESRIKGIKALLKSRKVHPNAKKGLRKYLRKLRS